MNVEPPTPNQSELNAPAEADSAIGHASLRIVGQTVAAIDGADHAAVVVLPERLLLASTSELAERLEAIQRSTAGPSVDAEHSGKIERINYLSDHVWPDFEAFCRECDVRSVAAFPLQDCGMTIGVMTLYSSDHHAFGAAELRIGRTAAEALVNVLRPMLVVSIDGSTPPSGPLTVSVHG